MEAERLGLITDNQPALPAFRAIQRALELLRDVLCFFVPLGLLSMRPVVETVFRESPALVVFKDAAIDVAKHRCINLAFEPPLKRELNEVQNELQGCGDNGIIFQFVVVISVMLNAVPNPLDVFDGFLLLGGDGEAEVLKAREASRTPTVCASSVIFASMFL
jgi:hypothetical protein